MENLKKLQELNLNSCSIEEIDQLLNNIGPLPIMRTEYSEGKIFDRAQRNKDEEPDFTTVKRMSYVPKENNKDYLRASTPDHTMFYGSVLKDHYTTDDVGYTRMTACCETSELLRDNKIPEGERIITLGTWQVQEPITLATIFDPTKDYELDYLNEIKQDYLISIDRNPDLKEKGLAYLKFLATEFSKDVKSGNNHEYHISALFTKIISNTGVDGVLYPSVRSAGIGLCVALHPRVADKLKLIMVNKCYIKKKDNKVSIGYLKRCNVNPSSETFELLEMEEFNLIYQK
ncbi:hypothetical protein [Flavobacterium granuli]|uniref:RES domain-containing protein n=1 Tax=Flavobacterium granuli TaxID=280093 RepID=A0ABU1S4P4_9FLAO|nr:hypothetical protein [Flavobacterium granuli]MDR6845595.1 hypothetical protein [Flavobacterium granuli]